MRRKAPVFNERDSYKDWRTLTDRWMRMPDVQKMGNEAICNDLILGISQPKARKEVLKRSNQIVESTDLFEVLDNLFRSEIDPIGELFTKYREFDTIIRENDESIRDYVERYMFLKTVLETEHRLVVPEPISCYKFIEGARVSDQTKQLVCTDIDTPDLQNYADRLKKAFCFLTLPMEDGVIKVKEEETSWITQEKTVQETLLMRKVKCWICGDPSHMQYECPHNECKYEKNHLGSYKWIGPESGENNKVDQSQHSVFNTPGPGFNNNNKGFRGRGNPNNGSRGRDQKGNYYNANNGSYSNRGRGNNGSYNGRVQETFYGDNSYAGNYHTPMHQQHPTRTNNPQNSGNYSNRGGMNSYRGGNSSYNAGMDSKNAGNDNNHGRGSNSYGGGHGYGDNNSSYRSGMDDSENVYFGTETREMSSLVGECLNLALLDSGAGKTVCGKTWLGAYESALGKQCSRCSNSPEINFRFGDGDMVTSNERVKVPAELGRESVFFETYVIDCDIPLLLSRETMKNANMTINFAKDEISLGEEPLEGSKIGSSGQYLIPILPTKVYGEATSILLSSPKMDVKKKAWKLHNVFAHASSAKIYKLQCEGYGKDPELLKALIDIEKSCHTCLQVKRAPPRPKSCLPLSSQVNECVAMDLKFINSKPVLHMIDTFSRFSTACFLTSKHAETVIEAIFANWINVFGRPGRFFSDNGSEFNNKEFHDLCEKFHIEVQVTPIEHPASNGICERHNAIIGEMSAKVHKSNKCSWKIALMWAVNAKNSLQNVYGYSPCQIVFGRNLSLPTSIDGARPADLSEGCFVSQTVKENLQAMHQAREEFTRAERKIRLNRALKSRVYSYMKDPVTTGDVVYYKRLVGKGLQGPATVITTVDKNVIIKHGGKLIRIHPSKLVLKGKVEDVISGKGFLDNSEEKTTHEDVEEDEDEEDSDSEPGEESTEDEESEIQPRRTIRFAEVDDIRESSDEGNNSEEEEYPDRSKEGDYIPLYQDPSYIGQEETSSIMKDLANIYVPPEKTSPQATLHPYNGPLDNWSMDPVTASTPAHCEGISLENTPMRALEDRGLEKIISKEKLISVFPTLKTGDSVKIKLQRENWMDVVLATRGGKKNSKVNKYHWNVVDAAGTEFGVYFDKIEDFRKNTVIELQSTEGKVQSSELIHISPEEIEEPSQRPVEEVFLVVPSERWKEEQVKRAMGEEVKKWIDLGVYEEVDDHQQQPVLSSRWVITEKPSENPNQTVSKARLVVRGYEEEKNNTNLVTNSPTAEKRSMRALFNVAVHKNWWIRTLDVKSAFLHSKNIGRVIYIKPPKEVRKKGKLWLLKKPVYGLKDASRQWYHTLLEELLRLGCLQSRLDKAAFTWINNGISTGVNQIHVDDMVYAGNKEFIDHVIGGVKNTFEISKEGSGTFSYVGVEIEQETTSEIKLSQKRYIAEIEEPDFEKGGRDKSEDLTNVEITHFRRLVGRLMWVATQTRPDILYAVLLSSTRNKKPTVGDMVHVVKLLHHLKVTELVISIRIQRLGNMLGDTIAIYCFTDARYGITQDKTGSIGGHVVLLGDGSAKCSILSWHCAKIRRVCTSAMDAEAFALMEGLKEAIYLRRIISEMIYGKEDELQLWIHAYTDNLSLYKSIMSDTQSKDVHNRTNIAWLQERSMEDMVRVSWVRSDQQMADALTRENSSVRDMLVDAMQGELHMDTNLPGFEYKGDLDDDIGID